MIIRHLLFSVMINSFLIAQTPTPLWTKTFGGSNIDVGYFVEQTSDAGFIIAGYTRSFGTMSGRNMWLIKTDANGNQLWQNAFGGNSDDEAYAATQTSDGGYILAGHTKSFTAGGMDVYLVKTDSAGNQLWTKSFGGSNDDEAYSVLQTSDGGFILAGATSSFANGGRDVWIIKTDTNGNQQWAKNYGGLSSDGARHIVKTSDGGYAITGWTYSQGPGILGNCLLLKIDSLGNQIWSKAFGGDDVDRGHALQQTPDGGYIITGYTDSFGAGLYDLMLIKTDNAGNEIWKKYFGGSGRDYGHSIQITSDNGFIITGYTLSYGAGGDDLWLVKTDSLGNELWKTTFGGSASDVGYWVDVTQEGDFIIVGHTLSSGAGVHDVYLLRISGFIPVQLTFFTANIVNGSVNLNWQTATEKNNFGFEIQRLAVSGQMPAVSGQSSEWEMIGFVNGHGNSDSPKDYNFTDEYLSAGKYFYRLKQFDLDGTIEYSSTIEVDIILPDEFVLYQNYPNPFNPETVISFQLSASSKVVLKIFDLLGNEVATLVNEEKEPGVYHSPFSIINSQFPSGVYFYQLRAGAKVETKQMLLLK